MLAYPTPTFDARSILQGPGHRPLGRGSQLVYEKQPEAITPMNCVNRHTANGGYVGSRSKTFIQDPYREPGFDPMKGTPLSNPGSVGNVGDQAISMGRPTMAEPVNGELRAIMAILNGKGGLPDDVGKLSAKQVESLGTKSKGPRPVNDAKRVVDDFTDSRDALRKERMISQAIRSGFTREEAVEAFKKVRIKEAEKELFKEQDPSVRLYDLIDSKISGTQNGSIRGNDETGLFLAKGGNAVLVTKAEDRNAAMDAAIAKAGRPSDVELSIRQGKPVEAIKAERKSKKKLLSDYPGFDNFRG